MRGITILFPLIASTYAIDINFHDDLPDINDMFVIEGKKDEKIDLMPGVIMKNITVNIEKLNITKFLKKLEAYDDKVQEAMIKPNNRVKEEELKELGISLNDTRRQALFWDWNLADYREASLHMTKVKTLDLMLQLIYMARHKLRALEQCKYFSRTDTGYRIAFVYRHLRRIFKKMMDIYSTMYSYRASNWFRQDWHLQLHTKATKLHVDFLYLWWVLIRVDEKYCLMQGIKSPVPKWMSSARPSTQSG